MSKSSSFSHEAIFQNIISKLVEKSNIKRIIWSFSSWNIYNSSSLFRSVFFLSGDE